MGRKIKYTEEAFVNCMKAIFDKYGKITMKTIEDEHEINPAGSPCLLSFYKRFGSLKKFKEKYPHLKEEETSNLEDKATRKRKRSAKNYLKKMDSMAKRFLQWKKKAAQRKIEWSLVLEDISNLPLVCYYTGKELTLEPKKENTISLDRVDSSLGYSPDNVVFCSKTINYCKGSLSKEDFVRICKEVSDYTPKESS